MIDGGTVQAIEPVTIVSEVIWNGGTLEGEFTVAPTAMVTLENETGDRKSLNASSFASESQGGR